MVESIRSLFDGRPIEILYHRCSDGEVYVSDAIAIDSGMKVRDREYRAITRAVDRHEKAVSKLVGAQLLKMINGGANAY